MLEENKMDYEKDICCPSSIAPSEEAIKDEDCKNCLIRTSCYYINSDEPKNKKNYWCNRVMSSYLKQLRAEVALQKKLQNQQEQHSTGEKLHDLMHQETAEEIDRSSSEETIFGYTREEFDKLYDETHGFNETYPDDGGPVSDMPFGQFLMQAAEHMSEGAVETVITDENGRQRTVRKYGDWRDNL